LSSTSYASGDASITNVVWSDTSGESSSDVAGRDCGADGVEEDWRGNKAGVEGVCETDDTDSSDLTVKTDNITSINSDEVVGNTFGSSEVGRETSDVASSVNGLATSVDDSAEGLISAASGEGRLTCVDL